jgi:replication fork protection complex subunit Tof1/Swi1
MSALVLYAFSERVAFREHRGDNNSSTNVTRRHLRGRCTSVRRQACQSRCRRSTYSTPSHPSKGNSLTRFPQQRAHIYSLCTALGGPSVEDPTTYTLGDDALACLKDLRRWLKFYDEKTNRYDVARCLSEMNLVAGDLLEILSQWKDAETGNKPRHRVALACVELLAPLTWPFEKMDDQMTVNHHRHFPVLQHAQMLYKKAILRHKSGNMLKTVVRTCLPAMAVPSTERSGREEGVIKLVLYVLRNIAIIEHPSPSEFDTGEEINRSATINAFADQSVFDLLLTIASGIGEEFRVQDGVLMEVLYHLIKGIDVESVFRSDREEAEQRGKNLTQLLKMEDDMKRAHARAAPTRHNRFGTTIWMERDDGTRSSVSGQDALLGKATGLEKIDKSKKWKKPKGGDMKGVSTKTEFDMKVPLEATARKHLENFVEDFIDSGFNPLFMSIRKALDRDVDRLLNSHAKQYFYLVAWFLNAERIRRRNAAKARKRRKEPTEEDSFSIVAAVLNQEFLVTLNRKMMEWFDMKLWKELQAGMRCFTQMLYTVQDMAVSPIEDDQEIAENIQNRLFYEETTMNLVYDICRSYTKQPFKWLDDCTEMVHVHLKLLEKYSQQHEHMFVRSRRRQNKKQKDVAQAAGEADSIGEENDEEMAAARRRAIAERAFDFRKFESKYLNQHCVNTFVAYLNYFKELDANQIMRAIKYFHRIFEKMKMEVPLYRLDLVDLFHRMMQGLDALPRSHAAYKDADQFARHYLRKLFKKLESEPSLYVELLFTKINHDLHFLQHGYDKEIHVSKPRAAADLHIKPGVEMNHGEQVGVGVGALLDENKSHHVEWLKDVLTKAVRERKLWEDEVEARRALEAEGRDPDSMEPEAPAEAPNPPDIFINPDDDERKTAMFKDGVLRFLLKLVGCEKVNVNGTSPFICSSRSTH